MNKDFIKKSSTIKYSVIITLLAIGLVTTNVAYAKESIIVKSTFENTINKWEEIRGDWQIKNNSYVQSNTSVEAYSKLDVNTININENYGVSVDLKSSNFNKNRISICFNFKDKNNYYSIDLYSKKGGKVELRHKKFGSSTTIASHNMKIKEDTIYNVDIKVINNISNIYINNELIFQEKLDINTTFDIALGTHKSSGVFDNVKVYKITEDKNDNNINDVDNIVNNDEISSFSVLPNFTHKSWSYVDGFVMKNPKNKYSLAFTSPKANKGVSINNVKSIKAGDNVIIKSDKIGSKSILNLIVDGEVIYSATNKSNMYDTVKIPSTAKDISMEIIANKKKSTIEVTNLSILVLQTGVKPETTPEEDKNENQNNQTSQEIKTRADGYGRNATGGKEATEQNIFRVSTKQELKEALSVKLKDPETGKFSDSVPRMIILEKDINLCSDSNGNEYIPGVTPVEKVSWNNSREQAKDVILEIPSNTTILGKNLSSKEIGKTLSGGGLKAKKGSVNIVIRYVNFEDAYDYFPSWSGEWNTELDNLVFEGTQDVWIDHCTFSDGNNIETVKTSKDKNNPIHHDGLLDIKKGANNITISNSVFKDHTKSILIGHSDNSESTDAEKFKVTMYGNYFENCNQRLPRVRFGQLHSYNNYYYGSESDSVNYVFGSGYKSTILSEDNIFDIGTKTDVVEVMETKNTYHFEERGSILNGNVLKASIQGASKPAYTSSASESIYYKYSKDDITTSNYKEIAQKIIQNAGHQN